MGSDSEHWFLNFVPDQTNLDPVHSWGGGGKRENSIDPEIWRSAEKGVSGSINGCSSGVPEIV